MEDRVDLPVPTEVPRVIPLARAVGYGWVGILLGGLLAVLGTVFLILIWQDAGPTPFSSADAQLDGDTLVIRGTVLSVRRGSRQGSTRLLHYVFEYQPSEGETLQGRSTGRSDGVVFEVGARCPVEYLPGEPGVARIQGTRIAPIPMWLWAVPAVMAGTGVVLLLLYLARIFRRRNIMQDGTAVRGRITGTVRRPWINPTPLIVYYEAEDPLSGQALSGSQWFLARSHRRLESAETCWVAVLEDLSGRSALLATTDWQAWAGPPDPSGNTLLRPDR